MLLAPAARVPDVGFMQPYNRTLILIFWRSPRLPIKGKVPEDSVAHVGRRSVGDMAEAEGRVSCLVCMCPSHFLKFR